MRLDLRSRLARAAAFCDLQSHGATDDGVRAEWLAHGQTCRDAATALAQVVHAVATPVSEGALDSAQNALDIAGGV